MKKKDFKSGSTIVNTKIKTWWNNPSIILTLLFIAILAIGFLSIFLWRAENKVQVYSASGNETIEFVDPQQSNNLPDTFHFSSKGYKTLGQYIEKSGIGFESSKLNKLPNPSNYLFCYQNLSLGHFITAINFWTTTCPKNPYGSTNNKDCATNHNWVSQKTSKYYWSLYYVDKYSHNIPFNVGIDNISLSKNQTFLFEYLSV